MLNFKVIALGKKTDRILLSVLVLVRVVIIRLVLKLGENNGSRDSSARSGNVLVVEYSTHS